ncbi:hypothetical protein B0T24DRAFT_21133 [Lasiosphaeria ovina]|uniref:Uncharacterized protein n=1 Tax=Lasiosphaeria ovina TaxID=92902 RepID=A0AAE0NJJ1_9PEZI|nr:hypothetical protein B0T24DRAFT_21133 [Lasiosphaeria ovina]
MRDGTGDGERRWISTVPHFWLQALRWYFCAFRLNSGCRLLALLRSSVLWSGLVWSCQTIGFRAICRCDPRCLCRTKLIGRQRMATGSRQVGPHISCSRFQTSCSLERDTETAERGGGARGQQRSRDNDERPTRIVTSEAADADADAECNYLH